MAKNTVHWQQSTKSIKSGFNYLKQQTLADLMHPYLFAFSGISVLLITKTFTKMCHISHVVKTMMMTTNKIYGKVVTVSNENIITHAFSFKSFSISLKAVSCPSGCCGNPSCAVIITQQSPAYSLPVTSHRPPTSQSFDHPSIYLSILSSISLTRFWVILREEIHQNKVTFSKSPWRWERMNKKHTAR